ncbi:MAG TPA: DNA alkylation repair protein [Candidatus Limnocylindrales bacterium]|nr:DNA alkylation repair protein [Candidatus Limnocylindrales bacterium]
MDVERLIERLELRLGAVASPERAAAEQRYLKSELEFLGVSLGEIRGAVTEIAREHRDLSHDDLLALVEQLWVRPRFELRMTSVILLARFADRLTVADLPLIERLVRESLTWALVDGLAGDVLGSMLIADANGVTPVMDRWAADHDFWIRRSSLLAELRPLRQGATLDRFLRRADPMLEEREFFIRKAIGWVLREASKKRPDEVAAWVAPRTHRASGVTMREAVKYLEPTTAERLMAAYRERRPGSATQPPGPAPDHGVS